LTASWVVRKMLSIPHKFVKPPSRSVVRRFPVHNMIDKELIKQIYFNVLDSK